MNVIRVFDVTPRRVLVSRNSARDFVHHIALALEGDSDTITLDFSGIEGMAPSFLDEILTIIDEQASQAHSATKLQLTSLPTELSEKFVAVGRLHGLQIQQSATGTWVFLQEQKAA